MASVRKHIGISSGKKVKRSPRPGGKITQEGQSYRDKVNPELLKEARQYKDFFESGREQSRKSRRTSAPQNNEFVYYLQDEKNQVTSWVIPLPLSREEHAPTIDSLTLTRESPVDVSDPEYLFKLIQGHFTKLPKQFAEMQVNIPLWNFCFEKTGKILAELVHQSLHDSKARVALAQLQLDYEIHLRRPNKRMKLRLEPHAELLAFGLNRGLDREDVTAEDRVAFLDDYCPKCSPRDDPTENRHAVTSIHRLWRKLVELRKRFSTASKEGPRGQKIEGLSVAAWQGFQEIRIAMLRRPRTLLEYLLSKLETSESLSAEQRALRDELKSMKPSELDALKIFLVNRSRRL